MSQAGSPSVKISDKAQAEKREGEEEGGEEEVPATATTVISANRSVLTAVLRTEARVKFLRDELEWVWVGQLALIFLGGLVAIAISAKLSALQQVLKCLPDRS